MYGEDACCIEQPTGTDTHTHTHTHYLRLPCSKLAMNRLNNSDKKNNSIQTTNATKLMHVSAEARPGVLSWGYGD